MNRISRQLKAEWELTFCAVAALVFIVSLAAGWMRLSAPPVERASRKQAPQEPSLLAKNAYAFLTPLPTPDKDLPSPFEFRGKTRAPKVAEPPTPKPRPKPKPKPEPEPEPKAAKPIPEVAEATEPEPPKTVKRLVYGVRFMTYLYSARNASGKPVATVQLVNPVTRQRDVPAMVPIGGAIEGIRILSFDEQNLTVQDARGKRCRIPFGKSARLSSAPRVVEVPR
jgi:outer membrane biosynthesis protein TonB